MALQSFQSLSRLASSLYYRWCVLVLIVFSGRLVTEWHVFFLVVLIERNFMLHGKIVYFVYGLRCSVQNCTWIGLVMLAWSLLFRSAIETSSPGHLRLHSKVSRVLTVLIATVIWLLKILLVKLLASSFHVATFFDRMKESVFHHYILEALSGPHLDEAEAAHPPPPRRRRRSTTTRGGGRCRGGWGGGGVRGWRRR